MNQLKIEHCIETVCQLGCKTVNHCIDDLEQQRPNIHFTHLNVDERQIVLAELKAIMAVYEGSCDSG